MKKLSKYLEEFDHVSEHRKKESLKQQYIEMLAEKLAAVDSIDKLTDQELLQLIRKTKREF